MADDRDHKSDTDWTTEINDLYAPDVVEKDGKYYLYAYIMNGRGCVGVSDKPEGPLNYYPNINIIFQKKSPATVGLLIRAYW